MTLSWAIAGFLILGVALLTCRFALRRSTAAIRHLLLAAAFGAAILFPLAAAILPLLEPVRRVQSTVVMVVGPDESLKAGPAQATGNIDPTVALLWLWSAGALVLITRMAFALDFRRRQSEPAPHALVEQGTKVARGLGITRPVRFERTQTVLVAETRGMIRPVVTLPIGAEDWPPERLDLVLTHELLHIARHDWIATVLAEAVTALHWFNPLAWLALRDLRREREVACDDAVLSLGVDGCDYAGHLLEIVSGLRARPYPASVAMAQASHLETRIRSILKPNSPRGGVTMKAQFGAAAFATCLLVTISAVQAPAQSGSSAALSGTVMDASSGRVPNASVIVRNTETRKVEIIRTDDTGEFVFSALPPGTYDVEVAKAGFQLFRQEKLVLAPGSAQNVAVVLSLGSIRETINVTGQRAPKPHAADTSSPPKRLRIGGGVQHAKLVKQVRPPYPPHLKTAGIQGTVLMEAVIGRDGTLQNLQVMNSLVHPDLIQAATESVRQWQWEPTYLNGEPVEIITAITVNFTLAP